MKTKIAIFGYGSLVNADSLAATLKRTPKSTLPVYVNNWIRDWSVIVPHEHNKSYSVTEEEKQAPYLRALNIRKDSEQEQPINGLLIEVTDDEMKALDRRERHYERVDITPDIITPNGFDKVYAFIGKEPYLDNGYIDAVAPSSYEAVVEIGFKSLGEEHYEHYKLSTRHHQPDKSDSPLVLA